MKRIVFTLLLISNVFCSLDLCNVQNIEDCISTKTNINGDHTI